MPYLKCDMGSPQIPSPFNTNVRVINITLQHISICNRSGAPYPRRLDNRDSPVVVNELILIPHRIFPFVNRTKYVWNTTRYILVFYMFWGPLIKEAPHAAGSSGKELLTLITHTAEGS
jgi:hypothetical protein